MLPKTRSLLLIRKKNGHLELEARKVLGSYGDPVRRAKKYCATCQSVGATSDPSSDFSHFTLSLYVEKKGRLANRRESLTCIRSKMSTLLHTD